MRLRYLAKLGLEPGCAEFPQCVLGAELAKEWIRSNGRKLKIESCCFGNEKGLQSRQLLPKRRRGSVTRIPSCFLIQCVQVVLGSYCRLGTFRVVW